MTNRSLKTSYEKFHAEYSSVFGRLKKFGRRTSLRIYREVIQKRREVEIVHIPASVSGRSQAFVVALYRSGTTPLRLTLDSHSKIASPPESQFIRPLFDLVDDPTTLKGIAGLGYTPETYRAELAALSASMLDKYAEATKPEATHWVDKTPHYTLICESLVEAFEDAKFVFLFRNPVYQIDSLTQRGLVKSELLSDYEGSAVEAGAKFWTEAVKAMSSAYMMAPERSHIVGYEELCADPETNIRGITEFLGLQYEPRMLSYADQAHSPGLEGAKAFEFSRFQTVERPVPAWVEEEPLARDLYSETAELFGYDNFSSCPSNSRLLDGIMSLSRRDSNGS